MLYTMMMMMMMTIAMTMMKGRKEEGEVRERRVGTLG